MESKQKYSDTIKDIIKIILNPDNDKLKELFEPYNYVTRKTYSGINYFILKYIGKHPYFGTFNQINSLGLRLKPSSKGIPVVFWKKLSSPEFKDLSMPVIKFSSVYKMVDTGCLFNDVEPVKISYSFNDFVNQLSPHLKNIITSNSETLNEKVNNYKFKLLKLLVKQTYYYSLNYQPDEKRDLLVLEFAMFLLCSVLTDVNYYVSSLESVKKLNDIIDNGSIKVLYSVMPIAFKIFQYLLNLNNSL